jgi:hypothetical protein
VKEISVAQGSLRLRLRLSRTTSCPTYETGRYQRKDAMTKLRDELMHPIPQMTTFELRTLREALEQRLAMQTLPPYSQPREELQQELSEVIAEQDERARIRNPPKKPPRPAPWAAAPAASLPATTNG